jgi:hypothetical protein
MDKTSQLILTSKGNGATVGETHMMGDASPITARFPDRELFEQHWQVGLDGDFLRRRAGP